jgi:hypothetical protein
VGDEEGREADRVPGVLEEVSHSCRAGQAVSRDEAPLMVTFVVRVAGDSAGRVWGSVTRVRTGESVAFTGIPEGARALAAMLTGDFEPPRFQEDADRRAGEARTGPGLKSPEGAKGAKNE